MAAPDRSAPSGPRVANNLWTGPHVEQADKRSGYSDYQQRVQLGWEGGRQLDHPLRRGQRHWVSTEATPITKVGYQRNLERAARDLWPVEVVRRAPVNYAPVFVAAEAGPAPPVRAYDRSVPYTVGTAVRQQFGDGPTMAGAPIGAYTIPGVSDGQAAAAAEAHPSVDIPGYTTHNFVRELPGSPRPAMRVLPQAFEVPVASGTVTNDA